MAPYLLRVTKDAFNISPRSSNDSPVSLNPNFEGRNLACLLKKLHKLPHNHVETYISNQLEYIA